MRIITPRSIWWQQKKFSKVLKRYANIDEHELAEILKNCKAWINVHHL